MKDTFGKCLKVRIEKKLIFLKKNIMIQTVFPFKKNTCKKQRYKRKIEKSTELKDF